MSTTIHPRLIVRCVDDAVAHYAAAFGAQGTFRYTEPCGSVAYCELTIGASAPTLAEDRGYGRCEGRIRDPFGHLWVVSQPLQAEGARS